jgi:hypothetical protein
MGVAIYPLFYFMLSTKYLVQSLKDVPETWIFQYYCKLSEKLTGQDVKIKSIFNETEKTPSMWLFCSNGKYFFKDFSTGKGGNAIKLVQEYFNEDFKHTSIRIIEDYNRYVLLNNGTEHKLTEFKVHSRYKVKYAQVRKWTSQDKYYWQQYNISSKILETYNVKPLEYYKMEKIEDDELKSLEIKGPFIYGYYSQSEELYKIYQPKVKEHKFIKIHSHLQGIDQLENHPFLLICSSLKDAMVIKSAKLNLDVVAPDSENTIIKKEVIDQLKKSYKKIITLFDNDKAGVDAMKKYKEIYDIDYVYFSLEKDVADAVKVHGKNKTFISLIPAIHKTLNND